MIGQLQDAGNTTTLAHDLELLTGAGVLTGLQKFAGHQVRERSSSPKLQVLNTALIDKAFGPKRKLLVGGDGIPLEKFLLTPAVEWVAG